MARIKTIEETDEVIKRMIAGVKSNKNLYEELKLEGDWKRRWVKLEDYVTKNLSSFGVEYTDYQLLWIRERFFL